MSHYPDPVAVTAETPPATAEASEPPVLVIGATSGWRAINLLEMWAYRDLFRALIVRDIKVRYRQTALGVLWVVIQPILGAGIFTVVFSSVAKLPSSGLPYFLLALAGTTGWNFFSALFSRASQSLVSSASLLTKVFFPRAMLPFSTVGSAALDLLVGLVMVVAIAAGYGYYPGVHTLALVPALLALTLVAMALGLLFSTAMVAYRDVAQILPVLVQLLLYASPVAYALSAVPHHLRTAYDLNPLVAPMEGVRYGLLGSGQFTLEACLSCGISIVVLGLIGSAVFRHFEQRFADVI